MNGSGEGGSQLPDEREVLKRRIGELEGQLALSQAGLEGVQADLNDLSYAISHDLRAPLRQAAGFASLLRHTAAGSLNSESAEYAQLIENAVQKMGRLIDGVLVYSRIGRAELALTQVEFGLVVQQAREIVRPASADRDVSWMIGPMPTVRGDASLLRQAMVCLLDNALKFTRKMPRPEIQLACVSGPAGHTFCLRDNGVGFDPGQAGRMFGFFQRLHHPEEFEGLGMGLANVRRIIQRHGGRTWAEGNLPRGASVYFTLPTPK